MHRERAVRQTEDPTNTVPDASGHFPMHRERAVRQTEDPTNTSETRIRHWNLRLHKTPPGGFEPRPKGLRGRNSPTCTLSQNGYGAEQGNKPKLEQHLIR